MSQRLSSRTTTYPCGICSRGAGSGSVRCHQCRQWFHGRCADLTRKNLLYLAASNIDWRCATCRQTANGSSDLQRPAPSHARPDAAATQPPHAATPPPSPELRPSSSQPERHDGQKSLNQGSPAECVACSIRSRRKATITCGSCQQLWHTSCAKIPAGKARHLPVWHCAVCLGRARANAAVSTGGNNVTDAGVTEGLAGLKRSTTEADLPNTQERKVSSR